MSPKSKRRGFDPEDIHWFSESQMNRLRIAAMETAWLLDRGYRIGPVLELVGGHYQLTARQRMAIHRGTSSQDQCAQRFKTMLPMVRTQEASLMIDGFNLIILLEVALSGSPIVLGRDGVLRDLAGLRGTYGIVDQTAQAIKLIGKALQELSVPASKFYLDAPVSNSGRLKAHILEQSLDWDIPIEVEIVKNPDIILAEAEHVVTGDSVILDNCGSWFNLSRWIVETYIEAPWVIDLRDRDLTGKPVK